MAFIDWIADETFATIDRLLGETNVSTVTTRCFTLLEVHEQLKDVTKFEKLEWSFSTMADKSKVMCTMDHNSITFDGTKFGIQSIDQTESQRWEDGTILTVAIKAYNGVDIHKRLHMQLKFPRKDDVQLVSCDISIKHNITRLNYKMIGSYYIVA